MSGELLCQVRLATALVQCEETDEAARVLGSTAGTVSAGPSPRLTAELRAARAQLQPWQGTHAVTTLDARNWRRAASLGRARAAACKHFHSRFLLVPNASPDPSSTQIVSGSHSSVQLVNVSPIHVSYRLLLGGVAVSGHPYNRDQICPQCYRAKGAR